MNKSKHLKHVSFGLRKCSTKTKNSSGLKISRKTDNYDSLSIHLTLKEAKSLATFILNSLPGNQNGL